MPIAKTIEQNQEKETRSKGKVNKEGDNSNSTETSRND